MYCRNCGVELKESAMFCSKCGTRVSDFYRQKADEEQINRTTKTISSKHGGVTPDNLRFFSMTMAVIACIFAIYNILKGIQVFFGIFSSSQYLYGYGKNDIFWSLINTCLRILNAGSFAFLAFVLYLVYREWNIDKARMYCSGILVGSGAVSIFKFIRIILSYVRGYGSISTEFLLVLTVSAVSICGYYFICTSMGIHLLDDKLTSEEIKKDIHLLYGEARKDSGNVFGNREEKK